MGHLLRMFHISYFEEIDYTNDNNHSVYNKSLQQIVLKENHVNVKENKKTPRQ
jgi:hypothetical protein